MKKLMGCLTGMTAMCLISGCAGIAFEKYVSKDPLLHVAMDKISGWSATESRGSNSSFAQVTFLSGSAGDRAIIALVSRPRAKAGAADAQGVVEDFVARRMKFADAKLISRSKGSMAGLSAEIVEVSYSMPASLKDPSAGLVLQREKAVIAEGKDSCYFLRYQNASNDFDRYSRAFDHIVKTVVFKVSG